MNGTIVFGVDVESPGEQSLGYATYGAELYHELDIPVTYFLTGKVIESHPDVWCSLEGNPLIHLEAHTYNHILLKTICLKVPPGMEIHNSKDYFLKKGATLEEIQSDLSRCVQVFRDVIGRPPRGLTGPWGYYRGLQDRPDILDIVAANGFKFLRTFLRDQWDGQPVPLSWTPFFYSAQGHPDILECLVHGYQDDFCWHDFNPTRPRQDYLAYMKLVTNEVVKNGWIWSAASHDHGCGTREGFEKKASWIREWVNYAKGCGIRFLSYEQFYQECLRQNREDNTDV